MNDAQQMTDQPAGAAEAGPDHSKFVTLVAAIWPGSIYAPGARFRIRDDDAVQTFARGRTGTVVTVEGPVALNRDFHGRKANVDGTSPVGLADVLDLLGIVVEMIHLVQYDDEPGVYGRLSHLWMEPVPLTASAVQPDIPQWG